ncbi:WD40-repeat-containing domain protein [Rhizoctonia solani]|nr:WD40-repeat-containing domain protein [Rhizoctonia solani]
MSSQPEPSCPPRPRIIHECHKDGITSVVFSPDGESIISSSFDQTIRICDTHNPPSIGEPLKGHTDFVRSVSYSPHGDFIASGSDDQTIRLWDVKTGLQLGDSLRSDAAAVYSVAFSPSANLIASGSEANTIRLWDVQKRTLTSDLFKGHTQLVYSVKFSHDGSRIVSSSYDRTVRVWDVERGTATVAPLQGHLYAVRSACFSPDSSQIVSCSYDHTLRLWDARTGRPIGEPYEGHTHWANSVAFSPDGIYIVSGSSDQTVRLWDVRTSRQLDKPFEGHTGEVHSVAFSPCGHYIAQELPNHLDSSETLEEGSRARTEPTQITHQMSTRDIFDCLIRAGCKDLSYEMDARQDTAMILSGGGFGDIWMGKLNNGGKVAIKAWRTNTLDHSTDKSLKRAARELFYWSRMDHPNIHQLKGVILFKGQYLGMVSEWMENGNLHEHLRKQPSADRYQLCIHVASGLEYMHDFSTIHGDLKAANVLVSSDGIARISDFDFSIMSEASSLAFSESSNTRSGSTRWAAPEILLAEVPSKRTTQSDVYALGMEIFTGDVPYPDHRMEFSVITTVARGTLPTRPVEQLGSDQQGVLVWELLLNCWKRDPSERPSSKQVADALLSYIDRA